MITLRQSYFQRLYAAIKTCRECDEVEKKINESFLDPPKASKLNSSMNKLESDFQKKFAEKDFALLDLQKYRVSLSDAEEVRHG